MKLMILTAVTGNGGTMDPYKQTKSNHEDRGWVKYNTALIRLVLKHWESAQ